MNKITNSKARRARKETNLDLLTEQHMPVTEIYAEDNNDYSNVDKIIEKLTLNEPQALALECRINGMSYPEISQVIGRAISKPFKNDIQLFTVKF